MLEIFFIIFTPLNTFTVFRVLIPVLNHNIKFCKKKIALGIEFHERKVTLIRIFEIFLTIEETACFDPQNSFTADDNTHMILDLLKSSHKQQL